MAPPQSHIAFKDSGEFLSWWFEKPRLDGRAAVTFSHYYKNYKNIFHGYLKGIWSDRHLELDKELERLKKKSGVEILDLGCGTGSVSLYMAHKLHGTGKVLGVDINNERLFCAHERKKIMERELGITVDCEFSESNVLSLLLDRKFDLIYLEEALHHMEPRHSIVIKICRLLKNGGVLIISEVNAYNPFMQTRVLLKRGFKTVQEKMGEDGKFYLYGAERIIPSRQVARLFRNHDMRMVSLRYFRVATSRLGRTLDQKGRYLMTLENRLCKISLLSLVFAVHYNMVLQKVTGH